MKIKLSKSDWESIGQKMGWLKHASGASGAYGGGGPSSAGSMLADDGAEKPADTRNSGSLKEAEMWCSSMSSNMKDQDDTGFSESIDPALAALEQAAKDGEAGNPAFMRCLSNMADYVSYFKTYQREKYNELKSMTKLNVVSQG